MRIAYAPICLFLAACGVLLWAKSFVHREPRPLHIGISTDHLPADGYATATLSIEIPADSHPGISLIGNTHALAIEHPAFEDSAWRAQIRAGVLPAIARLRVEAYGYEPAFVQVTTSLNESDSAGDGTPDFLRLDDEHDQLAFRRWFTYLAEAQYFRPGSPVPTEINDCAALIRYAYREALHAHDSAWANTVRLPVIPALETAVKYQYPYTPLGAAIFRTKPGSFHAEDLNTGVYLEFADAQTIKRYNTHLVSRDLIRAQPGDLLFFRQESDHIAYHSMIYLGPSQFNPDGRSYLLYHTGPSGSDPGEIRRLTLDELLHFPQPQWRPVAVNTSFLGIFRWNILREERQ
jgi:uncharacterized protein YfaT (DUF1175 family)